MHSQKGIVRIVPQEHLSVIMIKDRNTLIADLAMGSIISGEYEIRLAWPLIK